MVELIDWESLEFGNVGTPGWYTLVVKFDGHTRRPADRVFAAIENDPAGGRCHVLLSADFPKSGPEVLTPFSLELRITVDGVDTFVLVGASDFKEVRANTP